ncbi:HNH endonuclease [Vibrio phage 1.097.O._10N.286.49.B3]|uniref:Uncharacterized protein n=1 Tax=Vibrio phage 1.097.O._10N.286.49.B3 TaxID=1881383 RepID=A0A2I7R0Q2_9CAUD|nr:HNH endonuclease [Vibrio phage 1.097.O._10N.286.49.B3]AUR87223.1 hypothetical protein NVP1097O_77 [Vibrio phage 1.097.O._10N.286.49.B3]
MDCAKREIPIRRRLRSPMANIKYKKFPAKVDGKNSPAYTRWTGMMRRCYKGTDPTYADCSVVPEWHDYEVFAEWFYQQDWEGKELDKDSLIKGNRVYGPDTCTLLTKQENLIPTNTGNYSNNTSGYKGIGWHKPKGMWRVRVAQKHVGYFEYITEAVIARDAAVKEQYK